MEDLYIKYEKLGLTTYGPVPNKRQMEWYKREGTIFFHFGMNTFTDKEWGDGTESPSLFNPTELNVRQWIKTIKDAGFECAILTVKHHDGFCLWQSKYTEHSVKNSPYKNGEGDIFKEFTDACQEYGVKAGVYLSPWDRHEKTWGTFEYNNYYTGQLGELLCKYGKIWEIWWDGAGSTQTDYDWDWYAWYRNTYQKDAVIFGSLGATPYVDVRWVGNEKGIAGNPCYANIDESSLITEVTSELNSGKIDGEAFIPGEADVSIRPGWFYHSHQDSQVRTPKNLIQLWFNSIGRNAGFLLNVPPDRRGLLHENDVKSLLEFRKILNESFSVNLAKDAKIEASSSRPECDAENIISKENVYAPLDSDRTPEIVLSFENEIEFNTISISELIELGHKVTDISFYAYIENDWKLLFNNKVVGYKICQHFDTVKSSRVKIKVNEALDTPILHSFGIYKLDEALFSSDENAQLYKKAEDVSINDNIVLANFGGIFPFNEVKVANTGKCKVSLLAFNGTDYDYLQCYEAENDLEIKLGYVVDYAYQIKLEFIEGTPKNIKSVEIYKK
ncbi:MAG: alpha-L-fucosidase [Clostridia bacterium]|nr:alpha-L-fucosidase [Clostridia bacterium]